MTYKYISFPVSQRKYAKCLSFTSIHSVQLGSVGVLEGLTNLMGVKLQKGRMEKASKEGCNNQDVQYLLKLLHIKIRRTVVFNWQSC